MAQPLELTVFLRPASAKEALAYGPLALALHLLAGSPELQSSLSVRYEDGTAGPGKELSCRLQQHGSSESTTDVVGTLKTLASTFAAAGLAGSNAEDSDRISAELSVIPPLLDPVTGRDMNAVSSVADRLDDHLALRSFLVGYHPTAADFGVWGALKASPTSVPILRKGQHPHLSRWYSHIDSLSSSQLAVTAMRDELSNLNKEKRKPGQAASSFDSGLPGAVKGKVVTRFPPEPSGYLHIGHCKAAILNQHYAKTYGGRFLVRFDDTNPSKEKEEFQDAILEDLLMLDIRGDAVSYTSDYFDELYKFACQIIKDGKAFCDDTDQETMRAERLALKPSRRRDASVADNLARFADMTEGGEEGRRWCLRAKISYDDPNGALRDPVIYRVNLLPHHRMGDKWKVYPTYDFACPIVDSIEGVTHALRTNEYRDRNAQYWWMQQALGLRRVEIKDFARCNFVYTLLSKRKLKQFVNDGVVRGWDDPRFATVRGVRRRGMTIQALREFFVGQGDSQAVINMEWDSLWTLNKRIIDPIVPRYTALLSDKRVEVHLSGAESEPAFREIPRHKKNPELGTKRVAFGSRIFVDQEDAQSFEDGEEVTLMDWGNAIVRSKKVVDGTVVSIQADLHLAGDFKKTKKKITWLSATSPDLLQDVVLLDYDYLINKKKIEDDDNVDDFITPVTEFVQHGFADANVRALPKGEIIQFERRGYFIVDKPLGTPSKLGSGSGVGVIELIQIPDGRATSLASKSTPAPKVEYGLPVVAPKEAQDALLGPRMPVRTKMFRTEPHFNATSIPVTTKMFASKSIHA